MATYNATNERIKRKYLIYLKEAMRYSEASVDAVAKALSRFEADTKYRDFKAFHVQQAVAFKKPAGWHLLRIRPPQSGCRTWPAGGCTPLR